MPEADQLPARFWAVDLHVHTPASADVNPESYGADSPEQVVSAAISAGLDAIAITDHNTAAWCERVAEAAEGTKLTVLPGVEVSTSEGHVLALWDVGTAASVIEDLLTVLGIDRKQQGKVEVSSPKNIAAVAEEVAEAGGIAIAAHIDRERGLLKIQVADHLKRALLTPGLAALEIVDLPTRGVVERKVRGDRICAFTRASDVYEKGGDTHQLSAIGRRRTWIKASYPDLMGLRHALKDPDLRVRLEKPEPAGHCWIKSLSVHGGFLDGQTFAFSSDLNCLLGGTGAGKSLALELLRFALDNQTSSSDFGRVREEVDRRLKAALGTNSYVEVVLRVGDDDLTVRRVYDAEGSPSPQMVSDHGEEDLRARAVIRGFSQGEVIEYAREPVGRLQLLDAALDLEAAEAEIERLRGLLVDNGEKLVDLQDQIAEAEEELEDLPDVRKRVRELAKLFKADIVKQQEAWAKEARRFKDLPEALEDVTDLLATSSAKFEHKVEVDANEDLYERAATAIADFQQSIKDANEKVTAARVAAEKSLKAIVKDWETRFTDFETALSAEVAKIEDGENDLAVLRRRLKELQDEQARLGELSTNLKKNLRPALASLADEREELLEELVAQRHERRDLRRSRVEELNGLMKGTVRIRLGEESDGSEFRQELGRIAKGSHLTSAHLDLLGSKASPIHLVRSFLSDDPRAVASATEVPETRIRALFDHIVDRGRVRDFLELQTVETPDTLGVQFKKPETGSYEDIENLAHGQKCTAILIIAMADGAEPLLIDQPEDALHAPWIEEHLVSRLRDMRGGRQYIFATRSPGIVASADAEMIIALEASVDRGRVAAAGSLERHDLNEQTLYHLEGGPNPFKRRTDKFAVSL